MLTLPFTIWVLTTFMRELPKEIEEAAFVDGATPGSWCARVPAAHGAGRGDDGASRLHRLVERVLFALTFTLTNERRTVPPAIAS